MTVLWAADATRVGEVALVEEPRIIGRGSSRPDDLLPRATWYRQRPATLEPRAPLQITTLSRVQLSLRPSPQGLTVRNEGRRSLRIDGAEVEEGLASEGALLEVDGALLLRVARRPLVLAGPEATFPFARPDEDGLLGESPAIWALRARLEYLGPLSKPTLITGPSGAGKELVALGLHRRAGRDPWVSRAATTLPEGLVDAELFGSARNYPNAGMPERQGLIGRAHGGTLFLDEIGELPEAIQAHLLRVLDHGEYTRLGEASARRSDFRMLAATNRGVTALKHDVAARFELRVEVPALQDRLEDIPLLVAHLVRRAAEADDRLAARVLDAAGTPRIAPDLIQALVRHAWTTHVRELSRLLLLALEEDELPYVALTPALRAQLSPLRERTMDPATLTEADVRAALEACDGNRTAAYQHLGLRTRDQLYRLMKRFDIS